MGWLAFPPLYVNEYLLKKGLFIHLKLVEGNFAAVREDAVDEPFERRLGKSGNDVLRLLSVRLY
jgi:hypothetical protein